MQRLRRVRLGELECQVVADDSAEPLAACVLCHGFGADESDLVPLAGELCRLVPRLAGGVAFVFPAAPLELAEFRDWGGRAWWPLDLARLQSQIAAGALRDLRREAPPRLATARGELTAVLAALRSEMGVTADRVVLGGFSQGSMLATDVALHLGEQVAGLVIYSGTLLNEAEWRLQASQIAGVPVFQSHGTHDPILPFAGAEALRDLLREAGAEVEFLKFAGPHTIPPGALIATGRLIERVVMALSAS
jgi:phospholipase/carboxylesterase